MFQMKKPELCGLRFVGVFAKGIGAIV